MRTESYQLPGETHAQFLDRQRKLRQRRDDDARASLSSDTSPLMTSFDSGFSSAFDTSSSSDSSSSDSFSGGGGDFGGGGASSDF